MDCERVVFSGHAVTRMFQRAIGRDTVIAVIAAGEIIAEYPDDSPYPSCQLLGIAEQRPLHIVVARDDASGTCIVVTVYEPIADQWEPGFRKRRPR